MQAGIFPPFLHQNPTFLHSQILLFDQHAKKEETMDLQGSLNYRSPKFSDHISPLVKKNEHSLQIKSLLVCL